MTPRKKCPMCDARLIEFPPAAPVFMQTYFEYCPECKAVFYIGENL